MKLTIDASVFVSAARPSEKQYLGMAQVPLDLPLALRASDIAIENRLRGADVVYVAVAEDFEAVLVSWDEEMLERCPESVLAMSPEQWLENASRTGGRK